VFLKKSLDTIEPSLHFLGTNQKSSTWQTLPASTASAELQSMALANVSCTGADVYVGTTCPYEPVCIVMVTRHLCRWLKTDESSTSHKHTPCPALRDTVYVLTTSKTASTNGCDRFFSRCELGDLRYAL
jgi:hypothetical protein